MSETVPKTGNLQMVHGQMPTETLYVATAPLQPRSQNFDDKHCTFDSQFKINSQRKKFLFFR
jgi:hypothetical protein